MRQCSNCNHQYPPRSIEQHPCPRCGFLSEDELNSELELVTEIEDDFEPTNSKYNVRRLAQISFVGLLLWLAWVISEHLPA